MNNCAKLIKIEKKYKKRQNMETDENTENTASVFSWLSTVPSYSAQKIKILGLQDSKFCTL